MIHAIYLTTIVVLVAAGLWLLNQLRKVVDEKIEKEEQLDRISKAAFELFEYANSDEKNTAYELGKWEPRVFIAELNGGDVLCYEAKTLEEANGHSIVLRHGEWREMPKKVKLTRAEIAEKLGIDIDQLEITD